MNDKIDRAIAALDEQLRLANEFCESRGCEKNEHGMFIFRSANGNQSINLPFILDDYADWLVNEKKILKERL